MDDQFVSCFDDQFWTDYRFSSFTLLSENQWLFRSANAVILQQYRSQCRCTVLDSMKTGYGCTSTTVFVCFSVVAVEFGYGYSGQFSLFSFGLIADDCRLSKGLLTAQFDLLELSLQTFNDQ